MSCANANLRKVCDLDVHHKLEMLRSRNDLSVRSITPKNDISRLKVFCVA